MATQISSLVFGVIPLTPSQLLSWYDQNIAATVRAEASQTANVMVRDQIIGEVREAFRSEQLGKTSDQLNNELRALVTRYQGLARSKRVAATGSTPGRAEPTPGTDEASAEQVYQAIYQSYRNSGVDDALARRAASAGKAEFMRQRSLGADLLAATQAAGRAAAATRTGIPTPTPTPTPTPPINGGGLPSLPPLPPIDGGVLPPLPPLDGSMISGGSAGYMPPAVIDTTGTMGGATVKFDASSAFAITEYVPEFIATLPWGEIIRWLTGDDPGAPGILQMILARLMGRQTTPGNPANCNLMSEMFVEDFPEAAKAVAYFQCGVTAPIGLTSREAMAVWHALNLVASGVIVERSNGKCSCRVRG